MTIRSPTPARPAKVSCRPPRATPSRAISARPRVMSRALVLSPIAHAVAAAGTQGDDVLQGGAQLHAHHIVAGVHPEAVVHKQVLHRARAAAWSGQADDHAGGHPAAHLLGVGGAGEGHHGAAVPGLLRR